MEIENYEKYKFLEIENFEKKFFFEIENLEKIKILESKISKKDFVSWELRKKLWKLKIREKILEISKKLNFWKLKISKKLNFWKSKI